MLYQNIKSPGVSLCYSADNPCQPPPAFSIKQLRTCFFFVMWVCKLILCLEPAMIHVTGQGEKEGVVSGWREQVATNLAATSVLSLTALC